MASVCRPSASMRTPRRRQTSPLFSDPAGAFHLIAPHQVRPSVMPFASHYGSTAGFLLHPNPSVLEAPAASLRQPLLRQPLPGLFNVTDSALAR
jgi:hypothetical protein